MPLKRTQTTSSACNAVKDLGLNIKFHVQMMDYEWQRQNDAEQIRYGVDPNDTINQGKACDELPFIHSMMCWLKSNGLSYSVQEYKLGNGIQFDYDVKQTTREQVRFVDTIKLACFSQRPNMTNGPQENAGGVMNMSRNDKATFSLLCAKHFSVDDLLRHGTGDSGFMVKMRHNFSHNMMRVKITQASVCFAGTTYNDAKQYKIALREARAESFLDLCNSNMMEKSMLHTMQFRNDQIQANSVQVGMSVARCLSVHPHSIGSLLQTAYTCGMIEGEIKKLSDMGRFFQTDKGSFAPEWAAHNVAWACAVSGLQPHTPGNNAANTMYSAESTTKSGSPTHALHGTYAPPRIWTSSQIITMLHSTIGIPYISNEFSPYVSDAVCMPTLEQVQDMSKQGGLGTWPESAFELTECIDNAMSVPNDFSSRANDCEGGTAMHNMTYRNICGLFSTVQPLLKNLSSQASRNNLARWVCKTCNTVLPRNQHYAFAVQTLLLGLVAQYAADFKTLTVGATSASFTATAQEKMNTQEGGHSCGALAVHRQHIEEIKKKVYSAYTLDSCDVDDIDFRLLSKSIQPQLRMENVYTELGQDSLFSQTSSGIDLQKNQEFFIMESTTNLAPRPMDGYVTAKIGNRSPTMAQSQWMQVPFATYLQQMEVSIVKDHITDMANVRIQGFNTRDAISSIQPAFYNRFYMIGKSLLAQVENPHQEGHEYFAGVSANDFLYHKDAHMTMEEVPMPLLGQQAKEKFELDMEKQWEETRFPTVGRNCINQMMAKWHPAPVTNEHCPENMKTNLYRCTVTLSGEDGKNFINQHAQEIAAGTCDLTGSQNGLITSVQVARYGENTVVIMHTLFMDKMREMSKAA